MPTLNKEQSKNSHEKINESRQPSFNARNSENMGSDARGGKSSGNGISGGGKGGGMGGSGMGRGGMDIVMKNGYPSSKKPRFREVK